MKLLVATGSSGGHIYPSLAFLEAWRERFPHAEALLLLPGRNTAGRIEAEGVSVVYLSSSSLKPGLSRAGFKSALDFARGAFQSARQVFLFRPDIAVGFGSAATLAPLFFSWLLRAPVAIHEQNVLPGRANRLLANIAGLAALSFPESLAYFKSFSARARVTGNPLRRRLRRIGRTEALDFFGFRPDKTTLLVMGGSRGSRRLNQAFVRALSRIKQRQKAQVIHLAGTESAQSMAGEYRALGVEAKLFAFLDEMEYAYSAADLVISRAGAMATSEIAFFKLPAIVVPYPYAYRHQVANARALSAGGAARMIEDSALDSGALEEELAPLLESAGRLAQMRLGYGEHTGPAAAELLVKQVAVLAQEGHA